MSCSVCTGPCKAEPLQRVNHIRETISHGCDGPITPFVLICRAMEFAKLEGADEGRGARLLKDSDAISNALHEELVERGWITSDEDAGIVEADS